MYSATRALTHTKHTDESAIDVVRVDRRCQQIPRTVEMQQHVPVHVQQRELGRAVELEELPGKHACKRLRLLEYVSNRLAARPCERVLPPLLKPDEEIQQLHLPADADRVV